MNIFEISEQSGDSTLSKCVYSSGVLTLHLELDELDSVLSLQVKTQKIECMNIDELSAIERNCRVALIRISDTLETENGYYIAEKSFSRFMKSCKHGFNLAYGMKSNADAFFLSVVGYNRLVTCVVENLNRDVKWELMS